MPVALVNVRPSCSLEVSADFPESREKVVQSQNRFKIGVIAAAKWTRIVVSQAALYTSLASNYLLATHHPHWISWNISADFTLKTVQYFMSHLPVILLYL